MVKLTERLVLARSRASDLENVRKLNCWASDLTDVSVIQRMPNVQIVSLSVNHITTLKNFANSCNLEELYIRKNDISNLAEICHLCTLPKLRILWLADNPCAVGDRYRMTVLKTLPNLQRLDNIPVQEEELNEAIEQGVELQKPDLDNLHTTEDEKGGCIDKTETSTEAEIKKEKVKEVLVDGEGDRVCRQRTPPSTVDTTESYGELEKDFSSAEKSDELEEEDKEGPKEKEKGVEEKEEDDTLTVEEMQKDLKGQGQKTAIPEQIVSDIEEGEVTIDNPYEETNQIRTQLGLKALPAEKAIQPMWSRPSHSTKIRNANLLQASLCLIRELDPESLEILSDVIRNKLEAL